MLLDATGKPITGDIITPGHFASAIKAFDFYSLLKILPDPDVVMRKKGLSLNILRELLVDSHLEAVVNARYSSVSSAKYKIVRNSDDVLSVKAHDFIVDIFKYLDVPRIIEEMMEHVALGYKPMELIYQSDGNYWWCEDIVGKPQEWFAFSEDRELVFKTNYGDTKSLPPYKFVCPKFRATYVNPYGEKLLSKVFWPVTFKRTGFTWWTSFVEKYGGAFIFGTYPLANEKIKDVLLEAMANMISDAVAAIPQGTEIQIKGATDKASSSSVYKDYIEAANNEISKTWLGQTLTVQTSSHGNYATAKVHDLVREDITKADKQRIANVFNKIIYYITAVNFGDDVTPSRFEFIEEENLQQRAELDAKVFAFSGYKPTKEYLEKVYGYYETDIEKDEVIKPFKSNLAIFQKAIKTTKEDKKEIENKKIINEFAENNKKDFQKSVDKIIDEMLKEIDKAQDWAEVYENLMNKYPYLNLDEIVYVMNELQYLSSQVGTYEKKASILKMLFSKKKTTFQGN